MEYKDGKMRPSQYNKSEKILKQRVKDFCRSFSFTSTQVGKFEVYIKFNHFFFFAAPVLAADPGFLSAEGGGAPEDLKKLSSLT
jgi:hypothetical protein